MASADFLSPLEEFKGVRGRCCCLTGDFNYGTKDEVKKYIMGFGGRISSGVTKETNVLIVGEKGNANWAHGKYGRKVEVALLARKEGKDICIIAEKDFFRLMQNMPDGGQAPSVIELTDVYKTPELLAMAKDCFDDVINGVLPITDPEVEDTILYMSGIIEVLLDEKWKPRSERKIKGQRRRKRPFYITREEANAYQLKDKPQSASGIALELSAIRADHGMYRCSAWMIHKWLISQGYMEEKETDGRRAGVPTEAGVKLGLSLANAYTEGDPPFVAFDRNAQQFVIEHIEEICKFSFRK